MARYLPERQARAVPAVSVSSIASSGHADGGRQCAEAGEDQKRSDAVVDEQRFGQ